MATNKNQHFVPRCYLKAFTRDEANATINPTVLQVPAIWYARYVVTQADDSTRSGDVLLHTQTLHPQPTRWPSLLRWRIPGAVYTNGTAVKYIRECHTRTSDSIHSFKKERVLQGCPRARGVRCPAAACVRSRGRSCDSLKGIDVVCLKLRASRKKGALKKSPAPL